MEKLSPFTARDAKKYERVDKPEIDPAFYQEILKQIQEFSAEGRRVNAGTLMGLYPTEGDKVVIQALVNLQRNGDITLVDGSFVLKNPVESEVEETIEQTV